MGARFRLPAGAVILMAGMAIGFTASLLQADEGGPAYMIVSGTVVDPEGLGPYVRKAGPLAREAGIEVLARGNVTVFEGEWHHPRVITIEKFTSMAALEKFWNSDGYQQAKKLREGKFVADFIVAVEGN
ncbi:MAG: DUF1330 domain-containing protein [Proteobacteria bacterium]|nr:DUF1330 domain-containing protein [Pseudomonadota bacterium]